jgi:hypothetical protein
VTLFGIAVLGLLGCEGGDEATSVERNMTTVVVTTGPPEKAVFTREERVSQWITSCEVREFCSPTKTLPTSASVMEKDGVSGSAMRLPPTRFLQRRPSNLAPTSRLSSRSNSLRRRPSVGVPVHQVAGEFTRLCFVTRPLPNWGITIRSTGRT